MASHMFVLFLIVYGILLKFKDKHNMSAINSMTLPTYVASHRRTEIQRYHCDAIDRDISCFVKIHSKTRCRFPARASQE